MPSNGRSRGGSSNNNARSSRSRSVRRRSNNNNVVVVHNSLEQNGRSAEDYKRDMHALFDWMVQSPEVAEAAEKAILYPKDKRRKGAAALRSCEACNEDERFDTQDLLDIYNKKGKKTERERNLTTQWQQVQTWFACNYRGCFIDMDWTGPNFAKVRAPLMALMWDWSLDRLHTEQPDNLHGLVLEFMRNLANTDYTITFRWDDTREDLVDRIIAHLRQICDGEVEGVQAWPANDFRRNMLELLEVTLIGRRFHDQWSDWKQEKAKFLKGDKEEDPGDMLVPSVEECRYMQLVLPLNFFKRCYRNEHRTDELDTRIDRYHVWRRDYWRRRVTAALEQRTLQQRMAVVERFFQPEDDEEEDNSRGGGDVQLDLGDDDEDGDDNEDGEDDEDNHDGAGDIHLRERRLEEIRRNQRTIQVQRAFRRWRHEVMLEERRQEELRQNQRATQVQRAFRRWREVNKNLNQSASRVQQAFRRWREQVQRRARCLAALERLQAICRGARTRREFARCLMAVITIQTCYRGASARDELAKCLAAASTIQGFLRQEMMNRPIRRQIRLLNQWQQVRTKAATNIQRTFRGDMSRRRMFALKSFVALAPQRAAQFAARLANLQAQVEHDYYPDSLGMAEFLGWLTVLPVMIFAFIFC